MSDTIVYEKDLPCPGSIDDQHDWGDPEPDTGLVICNDCGARTHAREEELMERIEEIKSIEGQPMIMATEPEHGELLVAEEETVAIDYDKSLNYNEGKLGPALILGDMRDAFMEVLKVVETGAQKYQRGNWAKSINTEHHDEFLKENDESMWRHEFTDELVDQESGCHHTAHRIARLMFKLCYELRDERR